MAQPQPVVGLEPRRRGGVNDRALTPDDPLISKVIAMAGEMVVCFGFCEAAGADRYNTALCVTGDGVLGKHRKVHQPHGEREIAAAGNEFSAFDTPVGRVGMMLDYDKTFPSRPALSRPTAPT